VREKDGVEASIPTFERHLLCDERGLYSTELKSWEQEVLTAEMTRDGFKFWYRNPNRSSQDSLGISYTDGDDTRIVRPDFIFFAAHAGAIVADIVDPHGFHLADSLPKLRGLAKYAETHSHIYRRVEAVAKIGDKMRLLDLTRADVRQAVFQAENTEELYKGPAAGDY
jgi:hypothetical protein